MGAFLIFKFVCRSCYLVVDNIEVGKFIVRLLRPERAVIHFHITHINKLCF